MRTNYRHQTRENWSKTIIKRTSIPSWSPLSQFSLFSQMTAGSSSTLFTTGRLISHCYPPFSSFPCWSSDNLSFSTCLYRCWLRTSSRCPLKATWWINWLIWKTTHHFKGSKSGYLSVSNARKTRCLSLSMKPRWAKKRLRWWLTRSIKMS